MNEQHEADYPNETKKAEQLTVLGQIIDEIEDKIACLEGFIDQVVGIMFRVKSDMLTDNDVHAILYCLDNYGIDDCGFTETFCTEEESE